MLKLFLFFEEGPVGWKEVSQGGLGDWAASPVSSARTCCVGLSRVQILWEPLGPNLQNGST